MPDEIATAARQAVSGADALRALAAELERECEAHVHETWSYDPSTNAWETRNQASEDWVFDREQLIERIRTKAAAMPALAALGLAVVPVEPTEAMKQAAHSALYRWRETQGDPQQDPTNPEKHAIRWRAMLAAAPDA
jgi:hypothetical protein